MSKAGSRILASVRKARAFACGETDEGYVVHVPDEVNVRAIRKQLALTRAEFANRFGFSPDAVKEWETGQRTPDRSARILVVPLADLESLLSECEIALRDAVASRNGSMRDAPGRDAHVLALAWSVEADVWTTDRDFAGTGVVTWSTPNLMRALAGINAGAAP